MSIHKMIKKPTWQWRRTFATLVVNIMSVHLGAFLADFMLNNKVDTTKWLIVHSNMTDINVGWNKTGESMCTLCSESKNNSPPKKNQENETSVLDLFLLRKIIDTTHIGSKYEPRYLNAEGVYSGEWMRRITVFCIGAVIPLALYIGHRFGKKKALSVSAILFVIASLPCDAINISKDIPSIGAMMIFGAACAFQFYNVYLYVDEISTRNSRSRHHFIQILLIFTGLYLNAIKPEVMKTFVTNVFSPLAPVLFFVGLQILPESPLWLAKRHKLSAAKRALNWFRGEQSSTKLEDEESNKELENTDEMDHASVEFIRMFRNFESRKGRMLLSILINASCAITYYSFIVYINDLIGHWISHVLWIVLISYLLSSYNNMKWGHLYEGTLQQFLFRELFFAAAPVFATVIPLSTYKHITSTVTYITAVLQSLIYIYIVSITPSTLAPILIPVNVTPGVYVFSMISFWTAMWSLTEVWSGTSFSAYNYYLSLGYTAVFGCCAVYVYFFVNEVEKLEELDVTLIDPSLMEETDSEEEEEMDGKSVQEVDSDEKKKEIDDQEMMKSEAAFFESEVKASTTC